MVLLTYPNNNHLVSLYPIFWGYEFRGQAREWRCERWVDPEVAPTEGLFSEERHDGVVKVTKWICVDPG